MIEGVFFAYSSVFNVTTLYSCPVAGTNFSKRSWSCIVKVAVLMQGWHPKYSDANNSLSTTNNTLLSLSFINPIGETEPG